MKQPFSLVNKPASPPSALLPLAAALSLCGAVGSAWAQLPLPVNSKAAAANNLNLQQVYTVYPRISINGAARDDVVGFFAQGDTLYANHAALTQLGIQLSADECQPAPAASPVAGLPDGYFPLAQCTLVQHRYESSKQRLSLQAPIDRLNLPTTQLGYDSLTGVPQLSRPDFSAVLNYDATISGAKGASDYKGLYTQWRVGTPWGYFETNHIQNNTLGSTKHQRLDTYWRSVWPEQGLSLTVGDTYSSQLAGGGGSRMAGFKLESSFSTRPWQQKLPQTLFTGSTELPGAVDLYLNGVKQYGQDVAAGPYELTLPPTVGSAGTAQIVTRDALGRQTVVDVPLYDTAELLAPGLQEWSIEAGALRLSQSAKKQYDHDLLVSGSWRRGLTQRLTLQLHGEAKGDYRQGGIALRGAATFPTQLGGQLSLSQYQGKSGHRVSVFAVQQMQRWSLSAGLNQSSARFASLSNTLTGTPFVGMTMGSKQAYVQAGWSDVALGNFGLGRVWARQIGQTQDVWSLNWSKQIKPNASLMTGVSYDTRNAQQRSGIIGLNIQLGQNLSSSAYATRQQGVNGVSAQLQKSAAGMGDWGWNLGWQDYENKAQQALTAGVQHISQYGDGDAQLRRGRSGQQSWQASWRGGLVLLDGKMAATRSVYDSFAVVSTNGAAGIPIKVQNNLVGLTDSSGKIFIPNLSAYQNNLITIDSATLQANQRINSSSLVLVPYEKSGSKVRFEVQDIKAWTMTLHGPDGQVVPMGASILNAAGLPLTVVGFDGQVYVETGASDASKGVSTFRVVGTDAHGLTQECRFSIDLSAAAQSPAFVHNFGVVTCKP